MKFSRDFFTLVNLSLRVFEETEPIPDAVVVLLLAIGFWVLLLEEEEEEAIPANRLREDLFEFLDGFESSSDNSRFDGTWEDVKFDAVLAPKEEHGVSDELAASTAAAVVQTVTGT